MVRTVLRDKQLRKATLGFTTFSISEHATWLAIIVYAYTRGGVTEAGIVSFVQLVPASAIAPVASAIADRFHRGRVLAGGFALQSLTFASTAIAMTSGAPSWTVYLFSGLAATSVSLSRPAISAAMPSLVETPEQLTAGNVMISFAEQTGLFIGPASAALLLAVSEPRAVFFMGAALTGLGFLFTSRLQLRSVVVEFDGEDDEPEAATSLRELSAGLRSIRQDRDTRMLLSLMTLSFIIEGALDVAFVAVAIDLIGRSDATAGVFATAVGLGGAVGAVLSVSLVGRRRLTWPLGLALSAGGAAVAILATGAPLPILIALFAVQGASVAVADVAGRTMLQGLTPDDVLARVFGVLEGITMFTYATGSLFFSGLAWALGVRGALLVLGVAPLVFLAARIGRLLAIDKHRKEVDPGLLAMVRAIPIFAPLPPYSVEQVIVNLQRQRHDPNEVIITKGEQGDHFYIVEEGSLEVDSSERTTTIRGSGEFVGEIALLRDVPRTATVRTAAGGATLLSLERDVFLAAVTGHPRSLSRVNQVADQRLPDDDG